ncbi:centrosomal protein of 44 kDa-like isoform X2 [Symsagittifera roscoffensis]|uniref:centrosomal protein of 44 kDa-like isoform X2 n=1 Tax=Symsagittifera roscoffensis TaxID=84072 RepID=UPI00307CBA21
MDLVNNSLRRLHSLVAKMKYTGEFDADRMRIGDSYSLLPICNYGLLHFSSNLALEISNLGLEVYGTSDSKFVECLYRVMRDIFNYQPKIKQTQFLSSTGFAEKKISLVADVMQAINEKYPMKPKSKIVAASRVFPPNRSAPPNMGRVERNIPLEVKENGNGVKDLAAMCHQSNMRPAAVKVTEIVDEKTIAANGEQLASSAFRQVGVPQPMVQNHVTRADDFSSTNRFAHMLANGHDLETRDVRSQLEEQSNQLKEAMKSASEKEVVIVEKLDQVCSMLERLSSRQDRLESKVDELLNKPNSESSASRTLDNLSARTSLLETKIEMIESENSRIYRQSPVASITRNSHSSIIDQQRLVNGNNTKHLDGLSITELNDSNSSIKSSNAKSREGKHFTNSQQCPGLVIFPVPDRNS